MSSTPIFLRIRDDLAAKIDQGRYQVGDRLPAERVLAENYQVSRMTLRQAITMLVRQGKLVRRPGSGTYVSDQKTEVAENLKGVTSFTEIMESQGKRASSKFVLFKRHFPSAIEAANLMIDANAQVVTIERIRYGDGEPIAFEIATVPVSIVGNVSRDQLSGGLYEYLEQQGLHFAKAIQEFSAVIPDQEIDQQLKLMSGQAALFLRQTSFLTDGRPFEFVRTYYAGDRYRVFLERNNR
ncbi:GntR family transcriptional regulator [Oenococcus alcoholitolerans]|uniref:GntR family transcriptional regulator n=1 Tax=Oenococcus alcoholitolerans TaxID=931074 RepID=UPI003F703388